MFKNKVRYIRPSLRGTFQEQVKACLTDVEKILKENDGSLKPVLKQSIFLDVKHNEDFIAKRDVCARFFEEFYLQGTPPTSYVAQPPAGGSALVIELTLLWEMEPGVEVALKELDGITYVTAQYPTYKEVYGAGLTVSDNESDILRQSQGAFEKMKRILEHEGLSFHDVVRQWNYIQDITGITPLENGSGEKQNYQVFNDARSMYYGDDEFVFGYPAATGIGTNAAGVVLDFIAIKDSTLLGIFPVKNPDQVDAHAYSQNVLIGRPVVCTGQKTTPKFERAKLLQEEDRYVVYVSGTASIRGEKTLAIGDAGEQTRITIDNIDKLVSPENLMNNGARPEMKTIGEHNLSHCRVYIKHKEDLAEVEKVCAHYYRDIPIVYLVSDICRDALLVEIEGAVISK